MLIIIIIVVVVIVWGYLDFQRVSKNQRIRQNGGLKRLFPNFVEYFNSDFAILKTPFGDVPPAFIQDSTGNKLSATYGNEKVTKDGKFFKEQPLIIEIGIEYSSITEYYCTAHTRYGKDIRKVRTYITNRKDELSLIEYHNVFNYLYEQLDAQINLKSYY